MTARPAAAILIATAVALAAPALAPASSGGSAPGSGGAGTTPGPATQVVLAQPAATAVTVTGNGITVTTSSSTRLRAPIQFSGNAGPAAAGLRIEIERLGRQTNWSWMPTAHGFASPDGSFSATWPANHAGRFAIRAVLIAGTGARAAAASPDLTITVYRTSLATLYGPGFWGHHTACGQRLRRATVGVANRTLPCGTPVALYYAGRMIIVPVIDRGPYSGGANWDLTMATGRALGMTGTSTIGAVAVPAAHQ